MLWFQKTTYILSWQINILPISFVNLANQGVKIIFFYGYKRLQ